MASHFRRHTAIAGFRDGEPYDEFENLLMVHHDNGAALAESCMKWVIGFKFQP